MAAHGKRRERYNESPALIRRGEKLSQQRARLVEELHSQIDRHRFLRIESAAKSRKAGGPAKQGE
jgi:hypothetical protein